MSGAAHRGDDDIAFYAADIGATLKVSANAASVTQTLDVDGPLPPGRYLVQVVNLSDETALVWVGFGRFVAGSTIPLTAGPGLRRIPCSMNGIVAFETHVRKEDNDRVGAITTAGTADVYVTLVSRRA